MCSALDITYGFLPVRNDSIEERAYYYKGFDILQNPWKTKHDCKSPKTLFLIAINSRSENGSVQRSAV